MQRSQTHVTGIAAGTTRHPASHAAGAGVTGSSGTPFAPKSPGGTGDEQAGRDRHPSHGYPGDANNVYWANEYLPPSVMKVPIGGGTVTTLVALNDPSAPGLGPVCCAGISNVVSDGTNVYYSTPNFAAHTGGQVCRTVPTSDR